ncbi:MAG: DsbA family protein, partial [Janthinobacterium lividum]
MINNDHARTVSLHASPTQHPGTELHVARMGYTTTIQFTLDTICPWTYLARRRLSKALTLVKTSHPDATFIVQYLPYQLYPDAPQAGEDKYKWYKRSRYGDSEEKMDMYVKLMSAYGKDEGIEFTFEGVVAK